MVIETKASHPALPEIFPLPQHVAIIMDGNGRWARQRGLPRLAGHEAGVKNLHRVIRSLAGYGLSYLTVFAFSTENWTRPALEVRALFRLLGRVIREEVDTIHKNNVKVLHIGRLDRLSPQVQREVLRAIEVTRHNTGLTLAVALDYGGRADITQALKSIVREGIPPEAITEETVRSRLSTHGLPDPDLMIRTGGEMRVSNFLIWQSAYAEFYSTPTLWPDFDEKEVERALLAYSRRERRFGGRPRAE